MTGLPQYRYAILFFGFMELNLYPGTNSSLKKHRPCLECVHQLETGEKSVIRIVGVKVPRLKPFK
jgi:hypothetical protein